MRARTKHSPDLLEPGACQAKYDHNIISFILHEHWTKLTLVIVEGNTRRWVNACAPMLSCHGHHRWIHLERWCSPLKFVAHNRCVSPDQPARCIGTADHSSSCAGLIILRILRVIAGRPHVRTVTSSLRRCHASARPPRMSEHWPFMVLQL